LKPNEISFSSQALIELIGPVLSKGASFRFQVRGFSMVPFIRDNDVVTISSICNSSIGFGQPVAFINPCSGKLTIHRVIGKNSNAYLIKGDSIFKIDGLVPKENILGVITGIDRKARRIKLGLGPERFIIGLLSRLKILPLCFWCWMLIPFSARRFIKCIMHL
jgi:hypothetical protein